VQRWRVDSAADRSSDVILADLFPGPARRLGGHLTAAAVRGVKVAAILYEEGRRLPRVLVIPSANLSTVTANSPAQHPGPVVDAREHLLALLNQACHRLHQGVWSNSPFLSCIQDSQFVCEMVSLRIEAAGGLSGDPVAALSRLFLTRLRPRGLADLKKSYSPSRRR
jgi:hypothetical protein